MEEQLPDGSRVFRASWRSAQTLIIASMFVGTLVGLWLGTLRASVGWPLVAMALLFGWFGWLLARPMAKKLPVVQVGPEGVSGYTLRGYTIPWGDVERIDRQQLQGPDTLVLVLREGSGFLKSTRSIYSSGRKRNLPLSPLQKADQPLAADAVLGAFRQYGGANAQQVVQAALEQTMAHTAFERRLLEKTPSAWALYLVTPDLFKCERRRAPGLSR